MINTRATPCMFLLANLRIVGRDHPLSENLESFAPSLKGNCSSQVAPQRSDLSSMDDLSLIRVVTVAFGNPAETSSEAASRRFCPGSCHETYGFNGFLYHLTWTSPSTRSRSCTTPGSRGAGYTHVPR